MAAYYNEIDPYAAEWLRNLIAAGHIAPGDVDTRSIEDVHPIELRGYTQCHFFAGVGVWSRALRLAGWPDDRAVWTGSCPCQPFSAAGKGGGFADERHLWPAWHHLIAECRPPSVFGEQVASADGLVWFDLVSADLEAAGYAVGAADLCAAGVGAPHIRQRLWFVADAAAGRRAHPGAFGDAGGRAGVVRDGSASGLDIAPGGGQQRLGRQPAHVEPVQAVAGAGDMAHPAGPGSQGRAVGGQRADAQRAAAERNGAAGLVADDDDGREGESGLRLQRADVYDADGRGSVGGFWAGAEWIPCRDGKWRPIEPGTFPLAHGAPARVGRLRAYGNAINAEAAATFIRAAGV